MFLEAFKDEIEKYKAGDHSEFRRISLVYAFQDIVNSLQSKDDITSEILSSMDMLVQLQTLDSYLFTAISSDLLEPTIRLQILLAPKLARSLTQLSIAIATHSKAEDFQKELGNIISLLKSRENSHPFEVFKNAQGNESKDSFKTVITFYVPVILRMVEDYEIQNSMSKMMEVVDFIRLEVREYHAVLGTDMIHEVCEALIEKKREIRKNGKLETFRFLVELLDIYLTIGIFKQYRKEVIATIGDLFGDFRLILEMFNQNKMQVYNALALIAVKSIKGKDRALSVPSMCSGKFRLLLFVPVGIMTDNPEYQKKLLSHSHYYCEEEIDPFKITSLYPQFSPNQLIIHGVENMNSSEEDRKRVKLAYRNLFLKFSVFQRFRFIPNLMKRIKNELVLNFLLRVLATSDQSGEYFMKVTRIILSLRPVVDYFLCFSTFSKYLAKIPEINKEVKSRLKAELEETYEELMNTLNINNSKRSVIIEQFKRLVE